MSWSERQQKIKDAINRMKTVELIESMIELKNSDDAGDMVQYFEVKTVLENRFSAIDEDHIRSYNNMLEDHRKDQGT